MQSGYGQQQQMYPPQGNTVANGYYDKPADRRLRPWIIIGSILLGIIGAAMIITPLVHRGHLSILWAIFASGIALAAAAIVGLLAGFTLRPIFAHLFWIVLLAAYVGSIVLFIINACLLNHNMNNHCSHVNAARFSATCDNIRNYNIVIFSVFAPLVTIWVPALLIAAFYLARVTTLYRKQERNAYAQNNVPIGSGRL